MSLNIFDYQLKDYEWVHEKQLDFVDRASSSKNLHYLILCSHPSIVTLGRSSQAEDILSWSGPTMSISRGGKATYHGPEQLVAYPIINLKDDTLKIKPKDIHAYLRILEKVLILVLNDFSITAEQREQQSVENTGRRLSYTGVWVGDYKIASIGIAVKKWTAYHGFALNINHDEQAFNGIKACGFQAQTMTNMENLLGRKLNYHEISLSVQKHFKNQLFKN